MKITRRILAFVLSLIVAFSASISVSALSIEKSSSEIPSLKGMSDYKQYLMEEGYPVITTSDFLALTDIINQVLRLVTGHWIFPEKHFNTSIDPVLTEVCNHIFEESGLDIVAIIKNLPETNQYSDLITTVFQIDTAEFRRQMFEVRDHFNNNGNKLLYYITYFLGVYMSVIEVCEIYTLPAENDPSLYEVYMKLVFKDGGEQVMYPGIVIDSKTGNVTNKDNSGLVKTGFNFNLSEMLVYATINCWMREYGFCLLYDIVAGMLPVFFNYETRRFKFEYNDLEYMIQIWKGNYTIANGGEVGLYCRDKSKFGTYYDSANDEQMLEMSMQILHGDKVLVDEGPMMHWWVNGFNLGKRLYLPESLTLKFSIVMTDKDMLDAFCEAMDKHYKHDVSYSVDGLTVNVIW